MTYREKTAYLRQYRYIIRRIESLKAEQSEVTYLSAQRYDRVGHSTTVSSAVENLAIRIADYNDKIDKEISRLLKIRVDIERKINTLPKMHHRLICQMYFINGLTAEEIADRLDKTPSSIFSTIKKSVNRMQWGGDEDGKENECIE